MSAKGPNPFRVKLHRSYTVGELSALLGVHKNTVRNWRREGLASLDGGRPVLFHGAAVRAFLSARRADRKRPCPPGTFYCFRCRAARPPAAGMIDFDERTRGAGNLSALCGTCETVMHRRASRASLARAMPGLTVNIRGLCHA
jgi:excisionase family DNA binding protein